MSSPTRLRRPAVTAVVCAAALGGTFAAAALTGGFAAAARSAKAPEIVVPKLTIAQAATPIDDLTVGSTLTYTAAVKNTGKVVTGMSVADTLPDGVALIAADADQGGECSGAAPRITCTWATLAIGATATAAFVVQVIQPGELVNGMQLVPSDSDNTIVTTGAAPAPVEAGEGVAVRFTTKATNAATTTLAGK